MTHDNIDRLTRRSEVNGLMNEVAKELKAVDTRLVSVLDETEDVCTSTTSL